MKRNSITKHPDWLLVEQLEEEGSDLSKRAAKLIRELKRELVRTSTELSFQKYPDTTGQ